MSRKTQILLTFKTELWQMRIQRHAIFASVYSKQDILWGRDWDPTSRNIQELRDSTRISILLGSFRSVRRGLFRQKVPGIHYRVLVCFVLELASATLSISRCCLLKLKPVSFAFHRDLQLRSTKKADVAISRIDGKKRAKSETSFGLYTCFVSRGDSPEKKPTSNRFYENSPVPIQFLKQNISPR